MKHLKWMKDKKRACSCPKILLIVIKDQTAHLEYLHFAIRLLR